MQSGERCRAVAARFWVAPSSVVKWADLARRTRSVNPAKMGGYRRPILEPHRDWLLDQVRNGPNVTLAGLQSLGTVEMMRVIWGRLRLSAKLYVKKISHWKTWVFSSGKLENAVF